MNETVREWIDKAEDDYRVAGRELAACPDPSFDASCFHSQQCIEKLLKALLISHQLLAPRTHDLRTLSALLTSVEPSWSCDEIELELLNRAAVHYRYPGESADHHDASEALRVCSNLRVLLLDMFRRR